MRPCSRHVFPKRRTHARYDGDIRRTVMQDYYMIGIRPMVVPTSHLVVLSGHRDPHVAEQALEWYIPFPLTPLAYDAGIYPFPSHHWLTPQVYIPAPHVRPQI
eukprot:513000-Prorocentrum_minimum.AAC.1